MIIVFMLLNLSLFSKNVEMLKIKEPLKFHTVDSVRKDGYSPVILDENIITPFVVVKEDKEKYFTKLLETITLYLNYKTDYFDFNKEKSTKVKIDLALWEEKFPFDREGLKTFYNKLLNFIKRKSKEEEHFHKFLFIHEMIIRYSHLEKDDYLDSILYSYMEDDSVPFGYKNIILKNAATYEPLIIYKPIVIKRVVYKYFKIGTFKELFEERENFMQSLKIQNIYSLNNKQELEIFVKTLEDSLDSISEEEAYKDILIAIRNVVRADLVYDAIKNNTKLKKLKRFLEILISKDLTKASKFINDLSINKFLRKSLIINLIDMQADYEDAFKVRDYLLKELAPNAQLTKSSTLTEFCFQFLPLTKFLLTSKEILDELSKKENSKRKTNEIFKLSIKKYKELMKLEKLNEGNQIFRYMNDYYLLRQAVEYSDLAKDKNFELFIFSTLSNSLENKRIYLKEIRELEEDLIRTAYLTFLAIEISLEIDNLIFSKIAENRSLVHFLNSYLNLYNIILGESPVLDKSRDFEFDLHLKRAAYEIILSDSIEKLEGAKNIINNLLYNYTENVSSIYLLLNRALNIMLKNCDESLKEKVKEIESILEKYRK